MAQRKGIKWLLRIGAFVIAAVLFLWFPLPLWFPWVLKPVARKQGATYSAFQREGYNRFALSNLTFSNRNTQVRVERVEALVPTTWLWRSSRGGTAQPFLQVSNWDLTLASSKQESTKPPTSPTETVQSVRKLSHTLERWLPVATLPNGTLHLQTNVIKAPGLKWAGGDLEGRLELAVKNQPIALDASVVQSEAGYKIKFGSTNFQAAGEIDVAAVDQG